MASTYDDLDRPPLNGSVLQRALVGPGSMWTGIEILAETPSTNAVLADRARRDPASGLVVIAEHQTAGRGRLDRSWNAPARSGLTMSVLVRPYDVPLTLWPWIALLTGLAVAAAVREAAGVDAQLKWPNDVVVGERKLAGILVERVETPPYPAAAVIGIGLNVSLRADELPVPTATSLVLENAETSDRSVVARAILRTLEGLLGDWQRWGGEADHGLLSAYVRACTTVGRRVKVVLPGDRAVVGDAVSVDASGRLVVMTEAGREQFGAGDVVHLGSLT